MAEQEKETVALPENLRLKFESLRKRLFSLETLFAAAFAASSLFLSYFLLFISDRLWNTPVWLRLALFGGAALCILGISFWWVNLWLVRPRDLRALAVLVQKKYRRLGDRLLGIVELAAEDTRPAYFSPELYRAAIHQVADESGKYDFSEAADRTRARRQLYLAGTLLGFVILPALLLPDASWNAFRRWIAPLARIPRFTLVELAELPSEQIVPHGEKFVVSGKVKYRSFWKPVRVKLDFPAGRQVLAEGKEGSFRLDVAPLTEDAVATIRVGDAAQSIRFLAKHRPAIEEASARITLPEYLKYGPQEENAQSGLIEVLEGSSIALQGRTSRALTQGFLSVSGGEQQSLTISSNTFSTPVVGVSDLAELSLNWVDTLGLSNKALWKLAVQTKKDAAPLPQIEELYRDTAMLETEVLPIPIRAQDDFGLKLIGLNWALQVSDETTNSVPPREIIHEVQGTETKYVEHTINFSPAVMGVPPESTIEVRAFAVDYLPGRERSESPVYRIHVLGNAKHAEMIRQNLESLLVQLEEVTRLEERIASETRDIKDLQKLDAPETAKKISGLEQAQKENAGQLQELAAEGMKTLREALRNPAFNEEVLTDWTKNLHEMQKLAQQQMKEAAKSLQSAAQSPGSREQDLAEAQKKEEEAVEALQQMQQKVNEGLDELQALTLAQRLRQLGGKEKKIEETLQVNIPDTVGLMPAELGSRYQRANSQLATVQTETQGESAKIQGEISRFFERTQKPNYGQVSKEMTDSRAEEELDRIRTLIQENIGMEAMQNLALWTGRFEDWAAKLEPKSDSSSSGSGQGQGGEQENAALKQLLGLLRIREKQVNIQERTRLLNQHLDQLVTYRNGAVLLAASQSKLNRDLSKQAVDNTYALLEKPYDEALVSMSDVESLLDRPRTDEVTRSAQDKSLAVLTDLINLLNEEAKRQNSSSSSSGQGQGSPEQMAFLMQMMAPQPGMKPGQTAGANFSGGTTDKVGEAGTGDASGKESDGRSVKKSSSVPQNYPTEFRDALEKYYKALEAAEGK
jgi:hypothetical protein